MIPIEMLLKILKACGAAADNNDLFTLGDLADMLGDGGYPHDVLAHLLGRGYLRQGERMVVDLHLTAEGRIFLAEADARTRDRRLRRRHCRSDLLAWIDDQGGVGTYLDPVNFEAVLDGLAFSEKEIAEASAYLVEVGLAERRPDPTFAEVNQICITRRGSDCIDSNLEIPTFLEGQKTATPPANQVFNMAGTGNTYATATAAGASASASVSNTFNLDEGRLFAKMLRAAEGELPLDTSALAELERTDDPTIARRAAHVLYQLAVGTTAGVAGQILGIYGSSILGLAQ